MARVFLLNPPSPAAPALDRNFFQHPPHRVARIREALAKKASVTMAIQQRRMERLQPAVVMGVPAAGAR
jgi:hypothetical protein